MIQWVIVVIIVACASFYVVRRVRREWQLKMDGCRNCSINVKKKSI